jgi:hypothetical protein
MKTQANASRVPILFLAGLVGGCLGAARAIILISTQILGLNASFHIMIFDAMTFSAIFLTSLGFLGLHMCLDSVFGHRTFQFGLLTCACHLCYMLQSYLEGRTAYSWPIILSETSANTLSVIELLLLFSTSLFLMLCGLTLVRFGYDYSFGSELSWTGIFFILASFGIFTPLEYILILFPFLCSSYVFHSLAKWVHQT